MKKASPLFVLFLITVLALPSCAQGTPVTCRSVLQGLMDCEIGLPAGKAYDANALEGDREHISQRLISTLFGGGSPPPMQDGWLDMALFLPASNHPCEFAVILCDSPDTATDTARLLCRRLDSIRLAKGGEDSSYPLDSATVTVVGNYALLIVSSDTNNAVKEARKIIHRN